VNAKLGLLDSTEVAVCTKLRVGTVVYKVGHYVATGFDSDIGLPNFAKIVSFISAADSDLWYTVVQVAKTELFVSHFHAYKVHGRETPSFDCLPWSQLLEHQPLYCHSLYICGSKLPFIRLQHHIFKSLFHPVPCDSLNH